jgi:hypothetical protein
MSLIARLMDRRNRMLSSEMVQKKEKSLEDAKETDVELFGKGAYTNGIQGL